MDLQKIGTKSWAKNADLLERKMLKKEKNSEFRKRLLTVHAAGIRDNTLLPNSQQFVFSDGAYILLPEEASRVMLTAAEDFVEYLFTSMNVSAMRKIDHLSIEVGNKGNVILHTPQESEEILGEANGYMGYSIVITDNIDIYAYDYR